MTRSSLDACQRKQDLDFETSLCQNESETTEAIMEAKALCNSTIREAKAHWTTLIREAEAQHTTCIREAKANCVYTITEVEGCCYTAIRKAESSCANQACSIQLMHAKGMQCLEMEAIEEEGKDHLSFLATCGTALQACTTKPGGYWWSPPPVHGEHASDHSPEHLPQVFSTWHKSTLLVSHSTIPMAHRPLPGSKWWYPSPDWDVSLPQSEGTAGGVSEELPNLKWRDEMPLYESLMGSQWEAFAKDLDLVQKAREDYFKTNCPHFNHATLCDLMGIFWDMVTSASLLGSQIYEIQEVWRGQNELWYANDVLKTSPRGLQFFCPISP